MLIIIQLVLVKQLTRDTLEAALAAGADINAQHPRIKKTALCIAVSQGNADVVRLLLDRNADPNIECLDKKRTALWYATGARCLGRDSCLPIIRHLLLYQANPHMFSACSKFSSPLMNTVEHSNQKNALEAAKLILRDAIRRKETTTLADLSNPVTKQSAMTKAKTVETASFKRIWIPLLQARDPNLYICGLHKAIGEIAVVVNHTVSVVDKLTGGRFKKRFGIRGEEIRDRKLKGAATDPKNCDELKAETIGKLYDDGFQELFSYYDLSFFEAVIGKIVAFAEHDFTKQIDGCFAFEGRSRMHGASGGPDIPAAAPRQIASSLSGNVNKLTHLSMYRPILLLDNSTSMANSVRMRVMHEIVERILNVTTLFPPDDNGVTIRPLNPIAQYNPFPSPIHKPDIPTAVEDLNKVTYTCCTPLGTNLKNILNEFVYGPVEEGIFERPLLISIITDGEPNTLSFEFLSVLRECRQFLKLYDVSPKAVRFHLSQIGNNASAAFFLEKIRDDPQLSDIIYVATDTLDDGVRLTEYRENDARLEIWLLKTLLEPIRDCKDL